MGEPRASPIVCRDLTIGYRQDHALLEDVNLTVEAGRTVALVGESGCGKTTLLRTLAGLVPALGGTGHVLGVELPGPLPRGRLGYVPQSLGLVRNATVLRNVLLGTAGHIGPMRTLAGNFPRHQVARARDALRQVGLERYANERPARLSGGERRRVAIARALAQRPAALLADEILSELDVSTAATVIAALRVLQRETNMAVLLVEHDLDVAWEVADEVLVLQGGRIARSLTTGEGTSEALRELFRASA